MTKINRIKRKLDVLKPHYCEIVDESYKHASHNGGITESHLKIKIFTAVFIGKSLLEQHKIIHNLLADELASGLHALSIDTKTPLTLLDLEINLLCLICVIGTKIYLF